MVVIDTEKYSPILKTWKFIVATDEEVFNDLGKPQFPAVAVVTAESESQALLLLLKYCRANNLTDRIQWEWLFHCRIEQLPLAPCVSVYFTF